MTTRELAQRVESHREEMVHNFDMLRRNEGSNTMEVLANAVECLDALARMAITYIEDEHNGKIEERRKI